MNRHTEQQLLNFCVAQQGRFDAQAWKDLAGVTPEQKACALLVLADARWYGRPTEMKKLVSQFIPNQVDRLYDLSARSGFNCKLFVQRLQGLLWQRSELKH